MVTKIKYAWLSEFTHKGVRYFVIETNNLTDEYVAYLIEKNIQYSYYSIFFRSPSDRFMFLVRFSESLGRIIER